METLLRKEAKKIEKDWFDDGIGFFAIVVGGLIASVLLALTYNWQVFDLFQVAQHIVLLVGVTSYVGRQIFDVSWIYLVLSYKGKYETMEEKKELAYYGTKHVARTVFLVLVIGILYFFNEHIQLSWSLPLLVSFFILPFVYRILANVRKQQVEEALKKNPVQRMSADGKIDLSHLPFVFENLEAHGVSNVKVKDTYKRLQSLLDYVTLRVSMIDDIEIVHTLKRMGEEELPRLWKEYHQLEAHLQEEYEGKVLDYLSLFENKLNDYKNVIDNQKRQNIQTTFSLLDERYRN